MLKSMNKGLFLYNPKSGDQTIKNKLDYLFEVFQELGIFLLPFRLFQNADSNDKLLELIHSDKFSFIGLFGGDGTVNYIVNILIKNKINLPVGIFPCGTCNDFARGLGISNDIEKWCNMIHSGKTTSIDVGCINDHHYFTGNVGGGIFTNVSFNTSNDLKKSLGRIAYYLKALDGIPNIEAFDITLDTENHHIEESIILFLVLNGKNVAGFSNFYKNADMEDGYIDILLLKKAKPIELAGTFMKMLANELENDKHIIHIHTKEAKIQSTKEISITVDGEKGTILPIKVHCVHSAIRLFTN
jgi:diacylglycerol kinase (ATP)